MTRDVTLLFVPRRTICERVDVCVRGKYHEKTLAFYSDI